MPTFRMDSVEDKVKILIFYLEDKIKLIGSVPDKIPHIEIRDDQLFPDVQFILDILMDRGAVEIYEPFTYMKGLYYRLAFVNINTGQLKKVKKEYYKKYPGEIISNNDIYIDAEKMGIRGENEKAALTITYDENQGRIMLNRAFCLNEFKDKSYPQRLFEYLYKNANTEIKGEKLKGLMGTYAIDRIASSVQGLIRNSTMRNIFFRYSDSKKEPYLEFRNPITAKELKEKTGKSYLKYNISESE